MLVNADRKGPKNMTDLAMKAQAYKALLDAKQAHSDEADSIAGMVDPRHLNAIMSAGKSQKNLDDAFEQFADLHRDPETGKVNTGEMQATMNQLDAHLAKGKGI